MSDDSGAAKPEQIDIKVKDAKNNIVHFKVKRTTKLGKVMDAFCSKQGVSLNQVRFSFDGNRINREDTPKTVQSTPARLTV